MYHVIVKLVFMKLVRLYEELVFTFKISLIHTNQNDLSVQLIGEVYRMTYIQLFDLKKSLLETGQTVLANSVPVETEPPLEAAGLYQDLPGEYKCQKTLPRLDYD